MEKKDSEGMTVNEVLYKASKLEAFDEAARRRDSDMMKQILLDSGFTEHQAEFTVTNILAAPSRYGY